MIPAIAAVVGRLGLAQASKAVALRSSSSAVAGRVAGGSSAALRGASTGGAQGGVTVPTSGQQTGQSFIQVATNGLGAGKNSSFLGGGGTQSFLQQSVNSGVQKSAGSAKVRGVRPTKNSGLSAAGAASGNVTPAAGTGTVVQTQQVTTLANQPAGVASNVQNFSQSVLNQQVASSQSPAVIGPPGGFSQGAASVQASGGGPTIGGGNSGGGGGLPPQPPPGPGSPAGGGQQFGPNDLNMIMPNFQGMFNPLKTNIFTTARAFVDMVKKVEKFGSALVDSQRHLVPLSGQMSVAAARMDVQRFQRDVSRAQNQGKSFERLTRSQSNLERSLMPYQIATQNVMNMIGEKIATITTSVVEISKTFPGVKAILQKLAEDDQANKQTAADQYFDHLRSLSKPGKPKI